MRNFSRELKNNKWVFSLDKRNNDERPRVRIRPKCKDCVKQGLQRPARSETWCKGLCKKHAGQKGLKDPKEKQKTKKTCMMNLSAKVNKESRKKKQRPGTEIQKEHPATELPEDSEHSEVSAHEDGVVY